MLPDDFVYLSTLLTATDNACRWYALHAIVRYLADESDSAVDEINNWPDDEQVPYGLVVQTRVLAEEHARLYGLLDLLDGVLLTAGRHLIDAGYKPRPMEVPEVREFFPESVVAHRHAGGAIYEVDGVCPHCDHIHSYLVYEPVDGMAYLVEPSIDNPDRWVILAAETAEEFMDLTAAVSAPIDWPYGDR